ARVLRAGPGREPQWQGARSGPRDRRADGGRCPGSQGRCDCRIGADTRGRLVDPLPGGRREADPHAPRRPGGAQASAGWQPAFLRRHSRPAARTGETPAARPRRDGRGVDPTRSESGAEPLMDASELARTLASLEAGELRAHKAAAVLSALPPLDAVAVLGELIRRAERRSDPEAAALEGLLRAVRDLLDEPTVEALHAAAGGHLEVQALFARTQPARNFDHDREEWIDREMRARTPGERRSLPRSPRRRWRCSQHRTCAKWRAI